MIPFEICDLHPVSQIERLLPKIKDAEPGLVARIVELACRFGRYGCRRITGLMRLEG